MKKHRLEKIEQMSAELVESVQGVEAAHMTIVAVGVALMKTLVLVCDEITDSVGTADWNQSMRERRREGTL